MRVGVRAKEDVNAPTRQKHRIHSEREKNTQLPPGILFEVCFFYLIDVTPLPYSTLQSKESQNIQKGIRKSQHTQALSQSGGICSRPPVMKQPVMKLSHTERN